MSRNSIRCPACNCGHTQVTNTWVRDIRWQGKEKKSIKRRRVCRHCSYAWNTIEVDEDPDQTNIPIIPEITKAPVPKKSPKNPFI